LKKISAATIAAIGSGIWVVFIALGLEYFSFRSTEKLLGEHVELHLHRDTLVLNQALGSIEQLSLLDSDLSLQQHFLSVDASFAVLNNKGDLLAGIKPPKVIEQHKRNSVRFANDALQMIAYAEQADFKADKYTILVWRDMSLESKEIDTARWFSLGSALFAGLLGALGVGWLVAKQFAPIDALNSQIARNKDAFSLHELDIPSRGVEAMRLAGSYNDVVADLRNQFRDVERFAEHCAHELRTPLATLRLSIEGSLSKLESGHQSAEQNQDQQLQTQLETVDRLTVLINRLLSLARSRTSNVREAANVRNIVSAALDEISPLLEEAGWVFSNQIDPQHDVLCQPAALHQALIDLFDNCLKHNEPNGMIMLHSKRVDRMIMISIQNKKRFQSSFSTQSKVEGEKEGFGLGQPIVRRIMRDMGGSVAWISQPDGMIVLLHLQRA
jgi:signal transduction histidine kinase